MRRLLLFAVLFSASSLMCAQENPKYEFFGGYSLLHSSGATANGWEASGAYNFDRWIGVALDVSGHYRSESNDFLRFSDHHHFVTVGPQLSWRVNRGTLFGHALFGYGRESVSERLLFPLPPGFSNSFDASDNSFATVLGGGGDWNLGKQFAWRVAQLDYVRSNDQNHFRFSTGLVFRFGSR